MKWTFAISDNPSGITKNEFIAICIATVLFNCMSMTANCSSFYKIINKKKHTYFEFAISHHLSFYGKLVTFHVHGTKLNKERLLRTGYLQKLSTEKWNYRNWVFLFLASAFTVVAHAMKKTLFNTPQLSKALRANIATLQEWICKPLNKTSCNDPW